MPRKNLVRTNQYFYHITTRSNNREWFSIPMSEVWQICIDAFIYAQKNCPALISQFVLMSNHYHLLIRTPNSDIDRFMFFFNKEVGRKLRISSGRENRVFGSSYKWCLIKNTIYFRNAFKYIYQNPVRAGLCKRCQDYQFSTMHYTSRGQTPPFPFKPINHLEKEVDFINERYDKQRNQIIKLGLSRTSYKETRLRSTPN